jgi:hypothetical protein
MKRVRIDYTIYSPKYVPVRDSQGAPQDGHGECWDFSTLRGAKQKARAFGIGSLIVRNFNQRDRADILGDWWQSSFCWVWDGSRFKKLRSISERKWLVEAEASNWSRVGILNRFRSKKA